MNHFSFENLKIPGLMVITPFYCEDERGYFLKSYEKSIFEDQGIEENIFEDFESFSRKNVVRGLHFQSIEPQAKLVRVLQGEIYDVAVDLRNDSPTFGKHEAIVLNEESRKSFFIPKGCAHGFMVLSDTALVSYKCIGRFLKEYDTGIVWNDQELGIEWPVHSNQTAIVSERDINLPSFEVYKRHPMSNHGDNYQI